MGHFVTLVGFALHIGGGAIALLSGWAALFAAKGGWWHRRAGNIFFGAMIVMALAADYLAVVQPGQTVNLFIGTFTLYLIVTAWLTVRRPDGAIGGAEKIGLGVIALLCAPFVLLSFEIAAGLPPFFTSAVAFKGPIRIAVFSFTVVTVIATLADAKVVWAGAIAGRARIARHLWRMCLGLTLATGSAFTNGFARMLPGFPHVPAAFFLPQLVPLLFLVFWMIRVRLTGWYKTEVVA